MSHSSASRWASIAVPAMAGAAFFALAVATRPPAPVFGARATGAAGGLRAAASSPKPAPHVIDSYGKLPLRFERNDGQAAAGVDFMARGRGYDIALIDGDARMTLRGGTKTAVLQLRLEGRQPSPSVEGVAELPGKANYFIGRDAATWRRNIPTYGRIRYRGVYPGVDLVYYGKEGHVEYDFELAPHADPALIRISYDGAEEMEVDAGGDLVLTVAGGEVRQRKPVAFQKIAGHRRSIPASYRVTSEGSVGIEVGDHDPRHPLVIDPILSYATYLGGTYEDSINDVAVGPDGAVYLTGTTMSDNFPIMNPLSESMPAPSGLNGVFVTKINAAGDAVLFSTYLNGPAGDNHSEGKGIAVDLLGNVYVTGDTHSAGFPVVTPFQALPAGGRDAFVSKIDPTGSILIYSTYLGGSDYDFGHGIAVDASGNAYVTGATGGLGFPSVNAAQPSYAGLQDAFVAKLNPTGTALIYSTYLGGANRHELGLDIAIDAAGNAYVVGWTSSSDFPVVNAFQATFGGGFTTSLKPGPPRPLSDGFVTKVSSGGDSFLYSSYVGGNSSDSANAITVNDAGEAYIAGFAGNSNFPTPEPVCECRGRAFVLKLGTTGTTPVYLTYLGGPPTVGGSIAHGIALDRVGNVYIAGRTQFDFPLVDSLKGFGTDGDGFVTKIAPAGDAIVYSTLLGGNDDEYLSGLSLDARGNPWVAGRTRSSDLPVVNGLQAVPGGDAGRYDGVVAKLVHAPVGDEDNDGIADNIDTDLTRGSDAFSDASLGGTTPGRILSRGGAAVRISDASNPADGVQVLVDASGTGTPEVELDGKSSTIVLAPGTYVLTDPALTSTVTVGGGGRAEVRMTLAGNPVLLVVGDGGTVTFTESLSPTGTLVGLAVDSVSGSVALNGTPVTGPVVLGAPSPTSKEQCKKDGWRHFTVPRTFKNQGDCIQFVNTGK